METKHKNLYETPAITIVAVKQKGIICTSVTGNAINASFYNDGIFVEETI